MFLKYKVGEKVDVVRGLWVGNSGVITNVEEIFNRGKKVKTYYELCLESSKNSVEQLVIVSDLNLRKVKND